MCSNRPRKTTLGAPCVAISRAKATLVLYWDGGRGQYGNELSIIQILANHRLVEAFCARSVLLVLLAFMRDDAG